METLDFIQPFQGYGQSSQEDAGKTEGFSAEASLAPRSLVRLGLFSRLAATSGLTLLITIASILMAGMAQAAGYGDTGPYVAQIQRALGVYDDGVYGSRTESAVRSFQRSVGLYADGVVGSGTSQALLGAAIPDYGAGLAPGESGRYPDPGSTPASADLQRLLRDRGFDPGPIDGVYGPGTTQAVLEAQRFYGIQVDGIAGVQTIAALQGSSSDRYPDDGSSSIGTTELQRLLSNRGYYFGPIDGIYGRESQRAVRQFQRANGLTVDGIAGPQTIAYLDSANSGYVPTTAPFDGGRDIVYSPSYTREVQSRLRALGFYFGSIDSVYGAGTREAVRNFQADNGLVVDGDAGGQTLRALGLVAISPIADNNSLGSQLPRPIVNISIPANPSVSTVDLQRLLADNGFYLGSINGVYNTETEQAVRAAQRFYGLSVNGVAGPETISALRPGSTQVADRDLQGGTSIAQVQGLLRDRGFYSGSIDGINGLETRNAVEAAQRFYGLSQDGVAGPQLLAALGGSSGQGQGQGQVNIAEVQRLLRERGFYTGSSSGLYDSQTQAAVQDFQRFYGLAERGTVGPQTLAALRGDTRVAGRLLPTRHSADTLPVSTVQQLLAAQGFYTGPTDGVYSAQTQDAVLAFQHFYALPVDGGVGPHLAGLLTQAA